MYNIDNNTAVSSMPTPSAAGTPGWFTGGNPTGGLPATVLSPDWANGVQAELLNVLSAADVTPNKSTLNQLLTSLNILFLQKLDANLTLYVATTGSDTTGNGTSSAPFATIQRAINVIYSSYNLNGYTATISVAAGTYTSATNIFGLPVGGNHQYCIQIVGAGVGATIINYDVASSNAFYVSSGASVSLSGMTVNATQGSCVVAVQGSTLSISDVTLSAAQANTGSYSNNGYALIANNGSQIVLGAGIVFGACATAHISAGNGGTVNGNAQSYSITGGAAFHFNVGDGGLVQASQCAITLAGTPAFSSYFANAYSCGVLIAPSMTFSGSATGARYEAYLNGIINTGGAGASYFPGSTTGTTSTGGQYV